MWRERLNRISHCKAFHTSHGVAHVAYFVAVLAEGHGMYAMIGGVMVVFSLVTVVTSDD
jgi:hypothetical protein